MTSRNVFSYIQPSSLGNKIFFCFTLLHYMLVFYLNLSYHIKTETLLRSASFWDDPAHLLVHIKKQKKRKKERKEEK